MDIGAVKSISDVLSLHSSVELAMALFAFVFVVSLSAVIVVTPIVSDD